ncbi:MAG: thermonuclease family protein [Candidatus Izemoplasmataceae bacterium]
MKKILLTILFIAFSLTLIGCEELGIDLTPTPNQDPLTEWVALDKEHLQDSYTVGEFNLSDLSILVKIENEEVQTVALLLAHIVNQEKLYEIGTHEIVVFYEGFSNTFTLTLVEEENNDIIDVDYFYPEDIPYDGPRLNMDFLDMPLYQEGGNPYKGTGGAFYVGSWFRCIDGDTTVFDYPSEIESKITSNTPSTRYLNFDTPETFSGGEEVWGKTASVYNCEVLHSATSIILQTDPGDNLTGNYGRFLAWVWVLLPGDDDYQLLNYLMVRHGLAEVKYLFGAGETNVTVYDGLTYTEWMFKAEELALQDGYGMHSTLKDYYWDYEQDRPDYSRW